MAILGITANITGVGDIAGRVMYQIYGLFDLWTSAPQEIVQLGGTVGTI